MEKKAPRKEAHEPRDTGSDERIRPRDAQGDPDARRSPEMKRAAQDKKEERRDKGEMHEMKKDVVKDAAPRPRQGCRQRRRSAWHGRSR